MSLTGNGNGERAGLPGRNGTCFDLRLFVAGDEPKSRLAYRNLMAICRESLNGKYRITVVDLVDHPEAAREEQITAVPTLIRMPSLPGAIRIVGTLSDRKKVLAGLGIPLRTNGTAPVARE